jgi:hypothetical protein
MYKSNYLTKDQLTKFKILMNADKTWDKTLAHFTALFSLRKAYGNDKMANSGFEGVTHIRDQSSAHSVITANSKSDLICDLVLSEGFGLTCGILTQEESRK